MAEERRRRSEQPCLSIARGLLLRLRPGAGSRRAFSTAAVVAILAAGAAHAQGRTTTTTTTRAIDSSRRNAVVRAAELAMPAVVSISVTRARDMRENPFLSFFPDEFFDRS